MDMLNPNGPPYWYDYINSVASQGTPTEIHAYNAMTTRYYQRYFLQMAMSPFEWKLPENWDRDFFLYVLYCVGYVAIINTKEYGVIPQPCGLGGRTVQYQPRYAIISNEFLRGIREPVIDEQCVLMKLQPDYGGVMDLVSSYAEKMALADEALSMNLINSKLAFAFTASDKTAAESFKKLYDEIMSGKPAVFFDKKLVNDDGSPAWSAFVQNLGQNFIAPELIITLNQLEDRFMTKIGIPNTNGDKRERLTQAEVNSNNVETYTNCAIWLEELQKCVEKARNMFNLTPEEFSVDWRRDLLEGGAGNYVGNLSVIDRTV